MKKIYINPETKVFKLTTHPLLNIVSNGDKTLNAGGSQGDLGTDDIVLSRRRSSFWDDEE